MAGNQVEITRPWSRPSAEPRTGYLPGRFDLHDDRSVPRPDLIISYTAVAAGDTMTSHAGWLEAGGANLRPTAPRRAVLSAAAGGKATSTAASFAITGSGTIKGCFQSWAPAR